MTFSTASSDGTEKYTAKMKRSQVVPTKVKGSTAC
jgi:hypothetical protein